MVVDPDWRPIYDSILASFERNGGTLDSRGYSTQPNYFYGDPASAPSANGVMTSGVISGTIPQARAQSFIQEVENAAAGRLESASLAVTDAHSLRASCLSSRERLRDAGELERLYRNSMHGSGPGTETSTVEWAIMGLQSAQTSANAEREFMASFHQDIGRLTVYITVNDRSYNDVPLPLGSFGAPMPAEEELTF
jgi:hypothetical protein